MVSLVNSLSNALEEYDRPDLETAVKNRLVRAIYELHGVTEFSRDLTVSPPEAVTGSPMQLTIPSDFRLLSRIIAYSSTGEEMQVTFEEASVLNPVDYFNFAVPLFYMRRGTEIHVGYSGISPTTLAIEYLKWPEVDIEAMTTDSWIVETNKGILHEKLCGIIARLAGKQDAVAGHNEAVLQGLYVISGD